MMKNSIFTLILSACLLLTSGTSFANPQQRSTVELTFQQKRQWIAQLDQCRVGCDALARKMLTVYAQRYPDAFISLRDNAHVTFVYLHSYSLNPQNPHDIPDFLNQESQTDVNILAPVLTAHQHDSKPAEYLNVRPEDWVIDAELALKLGNSLGKPVVLGGLSLGGLLASYLAVRFPERIEKLLLAAPALMIKMFIDPIACAVKNPMIKIVIEASELEFDAYMEKYLDGVCSLSKTMVKLRNTVGGTPPAQDSQYDIALNRLRSWAHKIKTRTLAIYSEADEAVDGAALKAFSENLPNAKLQIFPKSLGISHLSTLNNRKFIGGPDASLYRALNRFIHE